MTIEAEYDPKDLVAGSSEHYEDAALYDFEYRRRRADVNYYRRLARDLGVKYRMLELACGTGRLLVPMARDGHSLLGIDLSRTMLARARTRIAHLGKTAQERIQLLRADMRAFALAQQFSLILCPFNALQHLYTHTDLTACLRCVRAQLEPDGRFAFDVMNPDLKWLCRDPVKRWARTVFAHPTTSVRYEYTTNQTYDAVTQIAHMRIYYKNLATLRTHVVRLAHRQFFPAELEALLHYSGFAVEKRVGGFSGEEFSPESDSQIITCRLAR